MSESQDGNQKTSSSTPQPGESTLRIDDSKAEAIYANFCRVNCTPEEVIFDLGLNPHPPGTPQVTVNVTQRIVVNHYTAKRLLSALSYSLQQHERVFGPVETDVRKRITGGQRGGAARGKGQPAVPPRPASSKDFSTDTTAGE